MSKDDYTEDIRVLAIQELDVAAREIEIARSRASEAFIQLGSIGSIGEIRDLADLESGLAAEGRRCADICRTLKHATTDNLSADVRRQMLFDDSLNEALYHAQMVHNMLARAMSICIGHNYISAERFNAVEDARERVSAFNKKLEKSLKYLFHGKKY